MELYRKYRPADFAGIVGNGSTIKVLKSKVDKKDLPHAILMSGGSGCGKTTIARIIANEYGCDPSDFHEIDSVDMSGVECVRDKRRQANFRPKKGEVQFFFYDECHRLSKTAQDALLKALESPKDHTYFILATTEPESLMSTVKNRCMKFMVEQLTPFQIGKDILNEVCRKEKKRVPREVLKQIGNDCLGSSRSALVILHQIIDLPEDEMQEAAADAASMENATIDLCRALAPREGRPNWNKCSAIVKGLKGEPESIRRAVLGYITNCLLNNGDPVKVGNFADVLECFCDNYFSSGRAGLALSVYSACCSG